jgi:hypothetical protein
VVPFQNLDAERFGVIDAAETTAPAVGYAREVFLAEASIDASLAAVITAAVSCDAVCRDCTRTRNACRSPETLAEKDPEVKAKSNPPATWPTPNTVDIAGGVLAMAESAVEAEAKFSGTAASYAARKAFRGAGTADVRAAHAVPVQYDRELSAGAESLMAAVKAVCRAAAGIEAFPIAVSSCSLLMDVSAESAGTR